jgi:hypothetical protein
MGELGELLRDARLQRKITLEQAQRATRIRLDYLVALEEGAFHRLPGAAYARGFVRSYARFLGLSADEVFARYERELPQLDFRPQLRPRAFHAGPRLVLSPRLLAALATVMLVLGFTSYLVRQIQAFSASARVASAPSPSIQLSPLPSAIPSPSPVPSPTPEGLQAAIHLDGRSWVEVTADGQPVLEGTYDMGTSLSAHAQSRLHVVAGVGDRVHVTINGIDLGTVGGRGQSAQRDYVLLGGRPEPQPVASP